MAEIEQHLAHASFLVSAGRKGTFGTRIEPVDARAWQAATSDALRDLTNLGSFFARIQAMSEGVMERWGVNTVIIEDTAVAPVLEDEVFAANQLAIHYKAGQDNYHFTIPARKKAAYNMASVSSLDVDINPATRTTAIDDLITGVESDVMGKNGVNPVTVTRIRVVED